MKQKLSFCQNLHIFQNPVFALKYLETSFQKPHKRHFLLLISILRNYLVRWHVLKGVYTGSNGCFWNLNPFGDMGILSTASGRGILKTVEIIHHSRSMGASGWTPGVGQQQASMEQSYTHLSYCYQLWMVSFLAGRNRFIWVTWAMETKTV